MGGAIPYCGTGPGPDEAWARWNLDPVLLAALSALALALVLFRPGDVRRTWCLATAWLLLAIAFVSPLCALASALFSVRVVHHLLLIAAAAPLLAAAVPIGRWVEGLRAPAAIALVTVAQAVIVWTWHAPGPYAAALSDPALYWVMQATLLGSAVAFWLSLRMQVAGSALAALLATLIQMGLLGALITFAPAPLYEPHFATTSAWGLAPIEDQQLAGLIMWIPAALPYVVAALRIVNRWLSEQGGRRGADEPA